MLVRHLATPEVCLGEWRKWWRNKSASTPRSVWRGLKIGNPENVTPEACLGE